MLSHTYNCPDREQFPGHSFLDTNYNHYSTCKTTIILEQDRVRVEASDAEHLSSDTRRRALVSFDGISLDGLTKIDTAQELQACLHKDHGHVIHKNSVPTTKTSDSEF